MGRIEKVDTRQLRHPDNGMLLGQIHSHESAPAIAWVVVRSQSSSIALDIFVAEEKNVKSSSDRDRGASNAFGFECILKLAPFLHDHERRHSTMLFGIHEAHGLPEENIRM